MPGKLISQRIHEVDIEKYPTQFEEHQGSLTIGDLHGNPVKLLYSLRRHGALKFKENGVQSPEEIYKEFVDLYNESGEITTINGKNQDDFNLNIKLSAKAITNAFNDYNGFPGLISLLTKIDALPENFTNESDLSSLTKNIEQKIKDIVPPELSASELTQKISEAENTLKSFDVDATETEFINQSIAEWKRDLHTLEELKDLKMIKLKINIIEESREAITSNKEQLESLNKQVKEKFPDIIHRFNNFLAKLEIDKKPELLRLIGDELADRGKNDYFMLAFMKHLKDNGLNFTVTISNHSNEFITSYEQQQSDIVTEGDRPSLAGLKLLIDNEVVTNDTISKWVEDAYKPSLKAIDYQLIDGEPPTIRLFSHAPTRFDIIEKIATKLGVDYNDKRAEDLAKTIDNINAKLATYIENGTIHTLCTVKPGIDPAELNEAQIADMPLVYLIWNRWSVKQDEDITARPAQKHGRFGVPRYNIEYYHGHDGTLSKSPHVFNLDNEIGKNKRPLEKQLSSFKMAEEEIANYKNNTVEIDRKLSAGEISVKKAREEKGALREPIAAQECINSLHYTVFSAEPPLPVLAAKIGFVDKFPPLKAIKNFFSDMVNAIEQAFTQKKAPLPERITAVLPSVTFDDKNGIKTKSELATESTIETDATPKQLESQWVRAKPDLNKDLRSPNSTWIKGDVTAAYKNGLKSITVDESVTQEQSHRKTLN